LNHLKSLVAQEDKEWFSTDWFWPSGFSHDGSPIGWRMITSSFMCGSSGGEKVSRSFDCTTVISDTQTTFVVHWLSSRQRLTHVVGGIEVHCVILLNPVHQVSALVSVRSALLCWDSFAALYCLPIVRLSRKLAINKGPLVDIIENDTGRHWCALTLRVKWLVTLDLPLWLSIILFSIRIWLFRPVRVILSIIFEQYQAETQYCVLVNAHLLIQRWWRSVEKMPRFMSCDVIWRQQLGDHDDK
jgi:hypothetical protein